MALLRRNPAQDFLQRTYEEFHRYEFRRQLRRRNNNAPCIIDLTHPFFMYLTTAQGQNYESAISQPEFQANVYAPIATLYAESFNRLSRGSRGTYDYVDLGPGYTSYLSIAGEHLFKRSRPRYYIPVDVNLYLLNKLCRFTRQLTLTAMPLNSLFELIAPELDAIQLANGSVRRLFNIGLTFNNYTVGGAVRLMRQLLRPKDSLLLCAESPRSIDTDHLLTPYQNSETEAFNRSSIAPLGVPRRKAKYVVQFARSRVEMGFRVAGRVSLPNGYELSEGDFLRTCISYRHRALSLQMQLRRVFERVTLLHQVDGPGRKGRFYTLLVSRLK